MWPNPKAVIYRLGKVQEGVQLENSTQQNGPMTDPIILVTWNLMERRTKLESVVGKEFGRKKKKKIDGTTKG